MLYNEPDPSLILLIEPSFVIDAKLAVLVRLIPPGASVSSIIDVNKFYALDSSTEYKVNYRSVAYRCNSFGQQKSEILLNGEGVLNFKRVGEIDFSSGGIPGTYMVRPILQDN